MPMISSRVRASVSERRHACMCAVVSATCTASSRRAMRVRTWIWPRIFAPMRLAARLTRRSRSPVRTTCARSRLACVPLFAPMRVPWYEPRRDRHTTSTPLCIAHERAPADRPTFPDKTMRVTLFFGTEVAGREPAASTRTRPALTWTRAPSRPT